MNIINFQKIIFKNFMKYGNKETIFNFSKGTNLITGSNGAGKSSIFMALHYVLFGKTYNGKTISSLVNNTNKKGMLVTLEFEVNDIQYRIERGISPNVFKIYKQDEQIPVLSTNTAYQEYLETSILKTTEQAFKNLIYLGGDLLSQSFLKLSKKEKEEVFSILSDTSIFLELQDRIKVLKKEKTTDYTNENFKLNTLNNLLQNEQSNYNSQMIKYNEFIETQKKNTDEIKAKIKSCNENIEKLKSMKETLSKFTNDCDTLNSKILEVQREISKNETNISLCEQKKECVGCPHFKVEIVDMDLYNKNIERLSKLKNDYKVSESKKNEVYNKMLELKPSIALKQELEKMLECLEVKIEKPSNKSIKDLEKQIKEKSVIVDDLKEYLEKISKLELLLNVDNIRGLFLDSHLPFINKTINKYISMFDDFNFSFELDKNLKETILKNNKPFEHKSMSNGESLRLTFSILLAFLDICRTKFNVKYNILVLDEVLDSALDFDGRTVLLKLLRNFKEQAIYIISHNADIKNSDYFDNVITIKNDKGFSILDK